MKILALADEADPFLWEHLDRRRLEGIDLILAAGDLPASYLSFLTCFTTAPILYVAGNHDTPYVKKPPEGCECVDDSLVIVKGLRILGLGGSMRYKPGPFQYTDREMEKRVRRLRVALWKNKGFDILLAHAPAYRIGDDTDLCHTGFKTFISLMDKYHPALMVHGHVHKNYSSHFERERQYGQTRVVNAYESCMIELPDDIIAR